MLDFPLQALVSQPMPIVWKDSAKKRGGRKPVRSQDLGCCNMIEIGCSQCARRKNPKFVSQKCCTFLEYMDYLILFCRSKCAGQVINVACRGRANKHQRHCFSNASLFVPILWVMEGGADLVPWTSLDQLSSTYRS